MVLELTAVGSWVTPGVAWKGDLPPRLFPALRLWAPMT